MERLLRHFVPSLACLLAALSACDSDLGAMPGQPDSGEGEQLGDGDESRHDSLCADGDSRIPSDCRCTAEGEACFSLECVHPREADTCAGVDAGASRVAGATCARPITCNDVCGAGHCVEDACDGSTWLYGDTIDCARPGEYSGTQSARCDEPIRFRHIFGTENGEARYEDLSVTCCCN